MKKYLIFIILLILPFVLVGCSQQQQEGLVLRVYNWQDYIDEGLDDDGQKIGTSVMEEWQEWYYKTYGEKVEFIRRYFPFIDDSHIVAMKHKHLFRCDVLIEDNLANLLATPYYHRICLNYPWNEAKKDWDWVHEIHRCYNWNDIVATVNKIKTESDVY